MAEVVFRRATEADVPAIVSLLADDALGAAREDTSALDRYRDAFAAIDADPHQLLVVGDADGDVVATLQLTIIPSLTRGAATRAQLEGVRVTSARRGEGIGEQLVTWALAEARRRGATLAQLTTDTARPDAHRFYERLGFAATHVGMKRDLTD